MNKSEERGVVLFYSTSAAIKAESLAKKENLVVKLIPVPRNLSSDCGICLLFRGQDKPIIEELLDRGKIEYEHIYSI
ncbi:MAG: hypothetical protein Kow00103_00470 [Candidatus Caldatribacteriota bacterium]